MASITLAPFLLSTDLFPFSAVRSISSFIWTFALRHSIGDHFLWPFVTFLYLYYLLVRCVKAFRSCVLLYVSRFNWLKKIRIQLELSCWTTTSNLKSDEIYSFFFPTCISIGTLPPPPHFPLTWAIRQRLPKYGFAWELCRHMMKKNNSFFWRCVSFLECTHLTPILNH